jgi:hypothetical protein
LILRWRKIPPFKAESKVPRNIFSNLRLPVAGRVDHTPVDELILTFSSFKIIKNLIPIMDPHDNTTGI